MMQAIKSSVGLGGTNDKSDSALVQAMLVVIKDCDNKKYLDSYDGVTGPNTRKAITNFQKDRVFLNSDGSENKNIPNTTESLVRPGDATWSALVNHLPDTYQDLRALEGSPTVYIQATEEDFLAKSARLNLLTFEPAFKIKLQQIMSRMYNSFGIAIAVARHGDRRDFQDQYDLFVDPRGVTGAGPGESNHNYGMAVDYGFEGLRWLRPNGTIVENETAWLHRLDPNQTVNRKAMFFWQTLRSTGEALATFRGPVSDRPHLQNWSDAGISMRRRLAAHLNRSGTMSWSEVRRGGQNRYLCDLGFGGTHYEVGTAAQIWNGTSTLNAAQLGQAQAQQTNNPATGRTAPAQGTATNANVGIAQQLANMNAALQADFEAADANWQNWTPN